MFLHIDDYFRKRISLTINISIDDAQQKIRGAFSEMRERFQLESSIRYSEDLMAFHYIRMHFRRGGMPVHVYLILHAKEEKLFLYGNQFYSELRSFFVKETNPQHDALLFVSDLFKNDIIEESVEYPEVNNICNE